MLRIAIFETNLFWSQRLVQAIRHLGHEASVIRSAPETLPAADVAILNLSDGAFELENLVPQLHAAGIHTVGHAGHKEHPKLELGNELGLDQVVSNSTITNKIAEILAKAQELKTTL